MKTEPIAAPKNWQSLKPHPLAELVEFGVGIDIEALADHMRKHGYDPDEPIVLHEGNILDGRHRHQAAIKAEVTPTFRQFVGKNAMAYIAKKLFRQHLDTSQRAMMAATLTKLSPLAGVQNCTPPTLAEAAETLNVSRRTVANASKILEKGTTELTQAVKEGTISVDDAVKVTSQSPDVQNAAVQAVRDGRTGTASEAVAKTTSSVFCETCQRRGPRRNCEGCHQLTRPGREPGSFKSSENGSTQFGDREWKRFHKMVDLLYGQVLFATGFYGKSRAKESQELENDLVAWEKRFKAWLKQISGKEPRPRPGDMVGSR
jgi:hypothetical protein